MKKPLLVDRRGFDGAPVAGGGIAVLGGPNFDLVSLDEELVIGERGNVIRVGPIPLYRRSAAARPGSGSSRLTRRC